MQAVVQDLEPHMLYPSRHALNAAAEPQEKLPALSPAQKLAEAFTEHFTAGEGFATIVEARRYAASLLDAQISPGTAVAKQVDEAVEAGVVRAARHLVEQADDPQQTYQKLVELYARQPTLSVRTSTSISQQAYSTPVPIAYLAATLVNINANASVYEPSAGHGSLLLCSNPAQATVNEINPERADDLRLQGYAVSERDALTYAPDQLHDVVIANPPFGSIQDGAGNTRQFAIPIGDNRLQTTQIDRVIALNALKAMKPDGRAVLILGGKLGSDETKRSDRYNTQESRAFYYTLYRHFNVTQHISIWGDLYRKQGAGFPIDLIVIEGRGQSARPLPAAAVPRIYRSFDELGGLLHEFLLSQPERLGTSAGRPSANGTATPERNPDFNIATLPGIAGAADRVADRALDGGSGGQPAASRTEALASRSPNLSSTMDALDNRPARSTSTALPLAASLGRDDRNPQRFNSRAIEPVGDRVSHPRGERRRDEGSPALDVPQRPTNGANPGRLVGQLDLFARRAAVEAQERQEAPATTPSNQQRNQRQQVPYTPRSRGQSVNTQVPVNMQTAVSQALDRLERTVGAIDDYVADRLQYGTAETLHRYFSAEQVDALALAIANIEQGKGFIIGDQTGIGKGRVVAGTIRYAKLTGRTPIFVTKGPELYADMMRDLGDINLPHFNPFTTNQSLKPIPLPDGRVLRTSPKSHQQTIRELQDSGNLGHYDAIFTTYSQLQTVKGKETPRRDFLRAFAPSSIIILDESHEAGGDANVRRKAESAANRADFVRELIGVSDGVLYSSATYAKRPDVMDLYFKTDMQLALRNMGSLASLVEQGGVPMQQALATMLSDAGQYIRRERSFEGVNFSPEVVTVNREIAENIASLMRRILEFDRQKQEAVEAMDRELKAEAKAVLGDSAVGGAGASSTNFTSVMHNLISQMLLSLKAEATVQKSLELLRQDSPEKPVIALSNTMGSFLGQYAQLHGLQTGDAMAADFGDLLLRYLERSREVIVGNPYGEKSRHRLTDAELGAEAVAEYEAIQESIHQTDLSEIPISPIDYITQRLTEEGYSVREITGRDHCLLYQPDGVSLYQRRPTSERGETAKINNVRAFNSGEVDVLILNRSGSTGISLHASEKFADQRKRHMLVLQPELDINLFMQTLGRVHRTGQVVPPNFTLLMADIPAEKRPGAVLAKKMASLNANTTASRSSGVSMQEIPDFLNEYGDRVVSDLMMAYPTLHKALDFPLKGTLDDLDTDHAVRKITGRLPLLPLAEQERLYDLIESEYRDLVARQEALGESILEAQSLDLDARPLARMEVEPADPNSTSPFTDPVYLDVVDVKIQRRPYTTLEAVNRVRGTLDLPPLKQIPESYDFAELSEAGKENAQQIVAELQEQVAQYKTRLTDTVEPVLRERVLRNLEHQLPRLEKIMEEFPVGTTVQVMAGNRDQVLMGVVSRIWRTGDNQGNPAAPSRWKIQFLLADSCREITVPLSRFNTGFAGSTVVTPFEEVAFTYQAFDRRRSRAREERQIFTGNLLRAFEKFPDARAINYSDCYGRVRTGLLTSQSFEIGEALQVQPVRMRSHPEAATVMRQGWSAGYLQTLDRLLTIKACNGDPDYLLQTAKTKAMGGKYFLNAALLDAAGDEFVSVADRMECPVAAERLDAVLQAIMEKNQWVLAAFEGQERARAELGIDLPKLEAVAVEPAPVPERDSLSEPSAQATVVGAEVLEMAPEANSQIIEEPILPLPAATASPQLEVQQSSAIEKIAQTAAPVVASGAAIAPDSKPVQVKPPATAEPAPSNESPTQTLEQLRQCYRAARDMSLGLHALERIKTLGQAIQTSIDRNLTPPQFTPEVSAAMKSLLKQYEPFQQRSRWVAKASEAILDRAGKTDRQGKRSFKGKVYHLNQTEDVLSVHKVEDSAARPILAIVKGDLRCAAVHEDDVRRFRAFLQHLQQHRKTAQSNRSPQR